MEIDFITKDIAVGRAPLSPEDFKSLKARGIRAVVSLQEEEEIKALGMNPEAEFFTATQMGLLHYRIPIRDFDPSSLENSLDEVVKLLISLVDKGYKVYVHCAMGVQRSPTVVAAYLMLREGLTVEQAVDTVTLLHPNARPVEDVLYLWEESRG